jgi:hypothetical protein
MRARQAIDARKTTLTPARRVQVLVLNWVAFIICSFG